MIKPTGGRVPHFRQILSHNGNLLALAGEAGGDTGSVWVYVGPEVGADVSGWVKLSRLEVEEVETK